MAFQGTFYHPLSEPGSDSFACQECGHYFCMCSNNDVPPANTVQSFSHGQGNESTPVAEELKHLMARSPKTQDSSGLMNIELEAGLDERWAPMLNPHIMSLSEGPVSTRTVLQDQDDLMIDSSKSTLPFLVEKKVACPQCGRLMKDDKSISRHLARQHKPDMKYFDCQEYACDYSTSKRADLTRHTRSKHPADFNAKPYTCPICGVGSSRKDNLNRHVVTCAGNTLSDCTRQAPSFYSKQAKASQQSGAERRTSTSAEPPMTANSTHVLVSWPSPKSRQAQREGPLRTMDRFEEPANPESAATLITTSPCHPASGVSFASRDVGSGSDCEDDPEDEISLYEQSDSEWAQDYMDAESGTPQNKRKRRTQTEKEEIYAKKSQKRNHPNLNQTESNDGKLKVSKKPPFKQYNYSLPCPYYDYNSAGHADCNGCSFDSISHLCTHLNSKHLLYYESRYIAHAPKHSESKFWPWPDVAAAVCRTCWATFKEQTQLVDHVASPCSSRTLETPENFDPENIVTLEQGADEKERNRMINVWKKYLILKAAFCDNFFPRYLEWQRSQPRAGTGQLQEEQTAGQAKEAEEEPDDEERDDEERDDEERNKEATMKAMEQPGHPIAISPNDHLGAIARRPGSPSTLECMVHEFSAALERICSLEVEVKLLKEREADREMRLYHLEVESRRHQTAPQQSASSMLSQQSQLGMTPDASNYLSGMSGSYPTTPFSLAIFDLDVHLASKMPNAANAQGIVHAPQQEFQGTVNPKKTSIAEDSGFCDGEADELGEDPIDWLRDLDDLDIGNNPFGDGNVLGNYMPTDTDMGT